MTYTCWIVYNGYLRGDKFRDYAEMIQEAAIDRGHLVHIYKNNELLSLLSNELALKTTSPIRLPDYCIFTDKDIYLAKQLELIGVRVFNRANTIELTDNKISTYQCLAASNLPIPKTIVAPKTFGLPFFERDPFLLNVLETFSFPFVVKEAYGSFGEQVYLVENEESFRELVATLSNVPFVIQQFVETSYGRDIRLQVIGEKVVAAMIRTSLHDFRANVTAGGVMEPYTPNEREQRVAIAAAKALGADFAGVDLLFGENDEPIICEVNSNAHIRNLLDCTGIHVAYPIIDYVETVLKGVKN